MLALRRGRRSAGSLRCPVGPPAFGLGLLNAVDDATLKALAAEPLANTPQVGRFGLKANVARLREQIAGAPHGDIGITSTLHPQENCSAAQTARAGMPDGPARRRLSLPPATD